MLVLQRERGERIVIEVAGVSVPLVMTVLDSRSSGRARLGFEGPRDFRIRRSEIVPELGKGAA